MVVLALAAAVAGVSLAAPAAKPGAADPKPAAVQHVLPDAQIERTIRAKLAKSKMSGTEHFTVSVQNGVATFEGKTNVIQHKGVATRLAKSSGAIAVKNNIQISDAARAAATAKFAKARGQDGPPARATVLASKPR
ncbi:MAG: BON domain-containing protein [Terriglobia bacterium]